MGMAVTTAVSSQLELSKTYEVRTIRDIGEIPTGLPVPSASPPLSPAGGSPEERPCGVVGTVISYGLGSMFGTKYGYTVPPNQECVAQGLSNLLGSFLSCLPMSASLSRSLVQETSGCKSMLTSLTSSLALIAVILSLAPLFQHLPVCVLAAIILASLAGMFKKMTDVKKFWARSPYDGALWLVTFLATVLVDVDIGLGVGVSLSILLIMLRSSVPSVTVMDREEILMGSTEREKLDEEANLKIIQVKGPINFLTLSYVKTLIQLQLVDGKSQHKRSVPSKKNKVLPSSILEVNIVDELKEAKLSDDEEYIQTRRVCKNLVLSDPTDRSDEDTREETLRSSEQLKIILNLGLVTWMDVAGCELISWVSDYQGLQAVVLDSQLKETLRKWDGVRDMKCQVYRALSDALSDINRLHM